MKNWFIVIFLLTLLLAACGGENPTPVPPPPTTNTPELAAMPTATTAVPTLEPTTGPPPTVAPLPTSTTEPSVSVNEGIVLQKPEDFGANRNPLTGELVENPENLQQRPLNVKISNAPANFTRPQSGLNDADWVFEHTAEGNLTRFTAIFYGKNPTRIGPIRSARLIDVELPAMFDAALIYSGSSEGVRQKLQNSDFSQRILYGWEPGYYRTGENKPYEHTLYGNPVQLRETLAQKEQNTPPNFVTYNAFSDVPPTGGTPTSEVAIDYNWTYVVWTYDAGNGRYWRWADGQPHADGNTLEQVNAANVVIMSPFHIFDPDICEQINANGTCASLSVEIQLWGSGPATVLRDGQRYDVTWHREGRNDMLTFTDSAGNPFPLKIGNTWVQLVPTWLENPATYSE